MSDDKKHERDATIENQSRPAGDGKDASAALALAVTSAEQSMAKPAETSAPSPEPAAAEAVAPAPWRAYGLQAAAFAAALGLGWFAGGQTTLGAGPAQTSQWAEAAASGIRENRDDVVRLTGDVRALKQTLDSLKDGLDRSKLETAGQQRPLVERLDRIERAAEDTAAKVGRLADASDRVEHTGTETGARLAEVATRLDKIERQASAMTAPAAQKVATAAPATTPAPAADGPAQTGSIPDAKPEAKPSKQTPAQTALDGWVLRDVFNGVALVEARNGRLVEIMPGQTLPNAGRVEAIERRGKTWVVVTTKGVIGPERWQ